MASPIFPRVESYRFQHIHSSTPPVYSRRRHLLSSKYARGKTKQTANRYSSPSFHHFLWSRSLIQRRATPPRVNLCLTAGEKKQAEHGNFTLVKLIHRTVRITNKTNSRAGTRDEKHNHSNQLQSRVFRVFCLRARVYPALYVDIGRRKKMRNLKWVL